MDVIDPEVSPGARPLPYGLATLATLSLWAYALAVVVSSFAGPVGEFDDALVLVHGALVQGGRTPSVDFWSFYPGGIHYLNAAAFSLFGKTVSRCVLLAAYCLASLGIGTVRVLDRLLRSCVRWFPSTR